MLLFIIIWPTFRRQYSLPLQGRHLLKIYNLEIYIHKKKYIYNKIKININIGNSEKNYNHNRNLKKKKFNSDHNFSILFKLLHCLF